MWYNTGQCDIPGYFDLPQNGYIGPPQCADSENVPPQGGIFRNLRVTSFVTFWNGVGGVFRFAPNLVCRASSMRWFRKCTSMGWCFSSLTSYKPCNFCKGVSGVFRFAPNSACRASSMRWFRNCTSTWWYFSSLTSYKPCNLCKGVGGVFRYAPNLVCRASSMRWFRKMYLYRVVFFVPYELQSLVTFVKESAGYFDLPQICYVGPPRCADFENVPP